MRNLTLVILSIISFTIHGQVLITGIYQNEWEAPYHFPVPENWTSERFPIPIGFAPEIPHSGVEDIRFAPGWGNEESEEYWTYAFLWYLDNTPELNATITADYLNAYYSGLINVNTDSTNRSYGVQYPVVVSLMDSATDKDNRKAFTGTVDMLDYMQRKPIRLYCIVHLKTCPDKDKTIVFFGLSPRPFTHKNWSGINRLWSDFRCSKH